MRGLVLFLSVSALGLGATLETRVSCGGGIVSGTYSAWCNQLGTYAAARIGYGWDVEAHANGRDMDSLAGFASARLVADFILEVTGGTGDGYAEACLETRGNRRTNMSESVAVASFGNESGVTMVGSSGYLYNPYASCDTPTPSHGALPFRFSVPITATLSLSAEGYTAFWGSIDGSAGFGGFRFFDSQMDLLSNVPYTFTLAEPLPAGLTEPATLPLVGVLASLILTAGRLRQRKA